MQLFGTQQNTVAMEDNVGENKQVDVSVLERSYRAQSLRIGTTKTRGLEVKYFQCRVVPTGWRG